MKMLAYSDGTLLDEKSYVKPGSGLPADAGGPDIHKEDS
jgi:hypothetical protein